MLGGGCCGDVCVDFEVVGFYVTGMALSGVWLVRSFQIIDGNREYGSDGFC